MTHFHERLRAAMGPDTTAAELARLLSDSEHMTVSRVAVGKWLSGETENVRMQHLVELAELLRVDLRWLMSGIGDPKVKPGTRPSLTTEEQEMLAAFRKLSGPLRKALQAYVRNLAASNLSKQSDELAPRRRKKA
jgi:transcriptional regulator with XRE-family HTH domain